MPAKKPPSKKPAAKKPAAKKSVKEEKNTDNTSNGTIAVEDEISKSFFRLCNVCNRVKSFARC